MGAHTWVKWHICSFFNKHLTNFLLLVFTPLTRRQARGCIVFYMKLPQSTATRFLCTCGHIISCHLRREGERLGFLTFFDAEEVSETYGEQVASCPDCEALLDYHLLLQAAR